MGTVVRKPFQGVVNIIRFNWHLYIIALVTTIGLSFTSTIVSSPLSSMLDGAAFLVCLTTGISLLASYYVYDYSGLYNLNWVNELSSGAKINLVNINAGFDETSSLLTHKFPGADLHVFDFYDSRKHTEISIQRARKAYPPFPETISIDTAAIPLPENSTDLLFNIFALHEIRDSGERIAFLKHQHAILKSGGKCVIVEHLRDTNNFLVYNIGFLHFHSLTEWLNNFHAAGFNSPAIKKLNPFVTIFILTKS